MSIMEIQYQWKLSDSEPQRFLVFHVSAHNALVSQMFRLVAEVSEYITSNT